MFVFCVFSHFTYVFVSVRHSPVCRSTLCLINQRFLLMFLPDCGDYQTVPQPRLFQAVCLLGTLARLLTLFLPAAFVSLHSDHHLPTLYSLSSISESEICTLRACHWCNLSVEDSGRNEDRSWISSVPLYPKLINQSYQLTSISLSQWQESNPTEPSWDAMEASPPKEAILVKLQYPWTRYHGGLLDIHFYVMTDHSCFVASTSGRWLHCWGWLAYLLSILIILTPGYFIFMVFF